MNPNYNLVKLIQNAIYALKREYGGSIVVYSGVPTINIETGVVTREVNSYAINRAIVLPVKVYDAVKTLGQGGLNGRLNIVGSHFDAGKRLFIIDRRDLSIELTLSEWIRYDGRKYMFETIEEYEYHTAYLVTAAELIGETSAGGSVSVAVNNTLTMTTQGATGP